MITAVSIVAVGASTVALVATSMEEDFHVAAEDYTNAHKCAGRMRLQAACFWGSCIVLLVSLL